MMPRTEDNTQNKKQDNETVPLISPTKFEFKIPLESKDLKNKIISLKNVIVTYYYYAVRK